MVEEKVLNLNCPNPEANSIGVSRIKIIEKMNKELEEKAEELVNLVFEKTNSSSYTKVWVSVIYFLVKNFLGPDDELEKVIIKGKNDVGKPYTIHIQY